MVLTSDRGLAGGFNANVFRGVQRFVDRAERGAGAAGHRDLRGRQEGPRLLPPPQELVVGHEFAGAAGNVAEARAQEVALTILEAFQTAQVDAVYLVYNEFKSAIQQRVVIEPLLPLVAAAWRPAPRRDARRGRSTSSTSRDKKQLLDALLPLYVQSQVYRALLESIASEFGARMTAMDNATSNAKEMIARLTLQYNRARQAAITKELMEIVGGAEALKG